MLKTGAVKRGEQRASGRVIILFNISPGGAIDQARLKTESLSRNTLKACILKSVETMKFPAHGGDPIRVEYPLSFGE
jgi:hypothetical protein